MLQPNIRLAPDPSLRLKKRLRLTGAMKGLAVAGLDEAQMLQTRGW